MEQLELGRLRVKEVSDINGSYLVFRSNVEVGRFRLRKLNGSIAWLNRILIHEQFRGQHLCGEMLQLIFGVAHEHGYRTLLCSIAVTNTPMTRCFIQSGGILLRVVAGTTNPLVNIGMKELT